jgi:hypothetical protein
MKAHEQLNTAIEGLSSFRHWAHHVFSLGAYGDFEAGMEAGKGEEYEAARLGLGKVLAVLTDADAAELLLKVTRLLPPFETFTPDPDYPFRKARSHYEDFSTSARDALAYWDALKALALRLEASELVVPKVDTTGWLESKPAAQLLCDYMDGLWSLKTATARLSELCTSGEIESIGKNRKRLINPRSIEFFVDRYFRNKGQNSDDDD